MRRLLGALLLLAVIAPFAPAGAASQVAEPTLTVGVLDDVPPLDPAGTDDFFAWDVLSYLSAGLTQQTPGTVEYGLALAGSHEVSADGLEHRFTLRADAAFNDGTPITAKIAADSINRTLRLHPDVSVFGPGVAGMAARADGGALVLTLTQPVPYLLEVLALPPFHPLPPALFTPDQLATTIDPAAFVGSGPYRPESRSADTLVLTADPRWSGEPPATPRLVIRRYDAPAALRDALVAGEVDLAWRGLPEDDIDLAMARNAALREVRAQGMQAFYLVYGLRNKPFDAPEARRALLAWFDRDLAVHTALRDRAAPMLSLLPLALADENDPAYPAYDAEAGAAALREGGFSRFRRLEGDWQTARAVYGDDYLDAVAALTRVLSRNPAVRIARFDSEPKTFFDQIKRGTASAQFVGWTPPVPHPDAYLSPLLASTGILAQAAGYSNPEVDRLLSRAAIAEPDAARALYADAQRIARQDVVAVPLWSLDLIALVGEKVDPTSVVIAPNFRLDLRRLRRAG